MKKIYVLLFLSVLSFKANAYHLKGGWIHYQYLSTNNTNNTNKYTITVQQFLELSSTGSQIDAEVYLGVFDNVNNLLLNVITIQLSSTSTLTKSSFPPCVSPLPIASSVGYRIDEYVTTIDLPINNNGYKLAVQRCCRVGNIVNIAKSDTVGFTYNANIPGVISGLNFANNSNPSFIFNDTVLICHNTNFSFPFKAIDNDGDSIAYSFCSGFHGGNSGFNPGPKPNPPANPPYLLVPYSAGFGAATPLGTGVSINANTGVISGIAPNATGVYSIAVCAAEYRAGILISNTKKEIHVNIVNCQTSASSLDTVIACNSYDVSFSNQSTYSGVTSYYWDFGDTKTVTDTSTQPLPSYTYPDSGTYNIKLKVTAPFGCVDSATSIVKVYPVFPLKPHITATCVLNPLFFIDSNFVKYKTLPEYNWNFGDPASGSSNTSSLYNPTFKYSNAGFYNILLTIKNGICMKDTFFTNFVALNTNQYCAITAMPSDTILAGTSITFTANTINSGANTSYQWYKNGQVLVGENGVIYATSTLLNNDSINCQITSTDTCVANKILISKAYYVKTKPSFSVSGSFISKQNKQIQNVQFFNNNSASSIINNQYKYFLAPTNNITLRPTKNNDISKANGVSSVDALLVQRHILNTTKLNSAYKLIAADVNGDKNVNSVDVLRIKRLILGTDTTFISTLRGNRLWEFVDSAYHFPDTTNPFPFKDSISFTNLTSNKTNQTFIGVKLGDVNYDWNPAVARGAAVNSVELIVNSEKLKVNNNGTLNIQLQTSNFTNLAAMQYTLHFDNTKYEFIGIENNKLNIDFNATRANENGNIAMLWTDKKGEAITLEDGTELFELILKPINRPSSIVNGFNNGLSTMDYVLTLTNDITNTEAWDKDFNRHNIILKSKVKSENPKVETENFVVSPNPTTGIIKVNLVAKTNEKITFELTNAQGKTLLQQKVEVVKGANEFTINLKRNANLTKGIYFLKPIGLEGEAVRKIIIE